MAINTLSVFPTPAPLIGQSKTDFVNNASGTLGYMGTFVGDFNGRVGEVNTVYNDINVKYTAVMNQAVAGGYSQAYLDGKLDSAITGASNDYEYGAWTPELAEGGTQNATYDIQQGTYVKIGKLITCQIRIKLTSLGGMVGNFSITGLPFVSSSALNTDNSGGIGYADGLTLSSNGTSLTYTVGSNGTRISLRQWNGLNGTNPLTSNEMTDSSELYFTISYQS